MIQDWEIDLDHTDALLQQAERERDHATIALDVAREQWSAEAVRLREEVAYEQERNRLNVQQADEENARLRELCDRLHAANKQNAQEQADLAYRFHARGAEVERLLLALPKAGLHVGA